MTFVTMGSERSQLKSLTHLLLSAFPGSVIYQQTNLLRVSEDVQETNVDAVFLQAEEMDSEEALYILRRWRPELPVFFLAEWGSLSFATSEEDAYCYLPRPITGQKLRDALLWTWQIGEKKQQRLSTMREEEHL